MTKALARQMEAALDLHRVDKVREVLAAGFDPDTVVYADLKETALHHAVRYHRPEMVDLILSAKGNVDKKQKYGHTALYIAVDAGRPIEVIRSLIAAGASVTVKDARNQTLLHKAASFDNLSSDFRPEVCQMLLDAGAKLRAVTQARRTVLHRAHVLESWKFFTAAGISPDYVPPGAGSGYMTPFQNAVHDGREEIVRYCVAQGSVDFAQQTLAGQSLWQLATEPVVLAVLRAGLATLEIASAVGGASTPSDRERRGELSPM
jgi:hypothetical protein